MIKQRNFIIISAFIILSAFFFTACSSNIKNSQVKTNPPNDSKEKITQGKNTANNGENKSKSSQPITQPIVNNQQNKYNLSSKKVVYLTFDDGPSEEITPQIISVLQKYNVKATFFVIGQYVEKHPELVKLELKDGFNVENHTYSHDVDYIYKSPENLLSDFKKNENLLKSIVTGYSSKLVRFPGGSRQRKRDFVKIVKSAGYNIIDWNCLSKDAENPKYTVNDLVNNIKNTSRGKNSLVVLMHDSSGRMSTVQSLPIIIEYFQSQGYSFELLT